jgi:hypothetical protein
VVRLWGVETVSEDRLRPEDAPKGIYGPDGEAIFFSEPGIDRMMAVIMNLASELWVVTERSLPADADRDAEARAFINRVFAPLREPES